MYKASSHQLGNWIVGIASNTLVLYDHTTVTFVFVYFSLFLNVGMRRSLLTLLLRLALMI